VSGKGHLLTLGPETLEPASDASHINPTQPSHTHLKRERFVFQAVPMVRA